ncbi:2003_t:CDS:2 [Ambispora gerdemannii]|uniref:2003_t:CDS:1 n=1 Tax=Ambispora gerdemannii TaxID=144530 RepID=A0A9N8YVU5_9GLOM|nr:2003_t:CDS:2 [Ambispora gerdemannii]
MAEKVIEVKQISKRYGDKIVLKNVSFSVRRGTIHGFIGPNGAGKTTTLSILTRLVLPTHGEVYIDNKSVNREPSFNQRLGFIPAEPKFPSLTVENYILDCGYLRDIPKEQVLRKLASSPLSQFRHQNCHSLSTGWKKILQVFTLSLYRPKILLLDEPFNGLDPSFRQDLFNNLKNIKEQGGTILMSTHILSDLQKLADDITMIKRGKIVYTGTKTADIEQTYEDYFIEKGKKIIFLVGVVWFIIPYLAYRGSAKLFENKTREMAENPSLSAEEKRRLQESARNQLKEYNFREFNRLGFGTDESQIFAILWKINRRVLAENIKLLAEKKEAGASQEELENLKGIISEQEAFDKFKLFGVDILLFNADNSFFFNQDEEYNTGKKY